MSTMEPQTQNAQGSAPQSAPLVFMDTLDNRDVAQQAFQAHEIQLQKATMLTQMRVVCKDETAHPKQIAYRGQTSPTAFSFRLYARSAASSNQVKLEPLGGSVVHSSGHSPSLYPISCPFPVNYIVVRGDFECLSLGLYGSTVDVTPPAPSPPPDEDLTQVLPRVRRRSRSRDGSSRRRRSTSRDRRGRSKKQDRGTTKTTNAEPPPPQDLKVPLMLQLSPHSTPSTDSQLFSTDVLRSIQFSPSEPDSFRLLSGLGLPPSPADSDQVPQPSGGPLQVAEAVVTAAKLLNSSEDDADAGSDKSPLLSKRAESLHSVLKAMLAMRCNIIGKTGAGRPLTPSEREWARAVNVHTPDAWDTFFRGLNQLFGEYGRHDPAASRSEQPGWSDVLAVKLGLAVTHLLLASPVCCEAFVRQDGIASAINLLHLGNSSSSSAGLTRFPLCAVLAEGTVWVLIRAAGHLCGVTAFSQGSPSAYDQCVSFLKDAQQRTRGFTKRVSSRIAVALGKLLERVELHCTLTALQRAAGSLASDSSGADQNTVRTRGNGLLQQLKKSNNRIWQACCAVEEYKGGVRQPFHAGLLGVDLSATAVDLPYSPYQPLRTKLGAGSASHFFHSLLLQAETLDLSLDQCSLDAWWWGDDEEEQLANPLADHTTTAHADDNDDDSMEIDSSDEKSTMDKPPSVRFVSRMCTTGDMALPLAVARMLHATQYTAVIYATLVAVHSGAVAPSLGLALLAEVRRALRVLSGSVLGLRVLCSDIPVLREILQLLTDTMGSALSPVFVGPLDYTCSGRAIAAELTTKLQALTLVRTVQNSLLSTDQAADDSAMSNFSAALHQLSRLGSTDQGARAVSFAWSQGGGVPFVTRLLSTSAVSSIPLLSRLSEPARATYGMAVLAALLDSSSGAAVSVCSVGQLLPTLTGLNDAASLKHSRHARAKVNEVMQRLKPASVLTQGGLAGLFTYIDNLSNKLQEEMETVLRPTASDSKSGSTTPGGTTTAGDSATQSKKGASGDQEALYILCALQGGVQLLASLGTLHGVDDDGLRPVVGLGVSALQVRGHLSYLFGRGLVGTLMALLEVSADFIEAVVRTHAPPAQHIPPPPTPSSSSSSSKSSRRKGTNRGNNKKSSSSSSKSASSSSTSAASDSAAASLQMAEADIRTHVQLFSRILEHSLYLVNRLLSLFDRRGHGDGFHSLSLLAVLLKVQLAISACPEYFPPSALADLAPGVPTHVGDPLVAPLADWPPTSQSRKYMYAQPIRTTGHSSRAIGQYLATAVGSLVQAAISRAVAAGVSDTGSSLIAALETEDQKQSAAGAGSKDGGAALGSATPTNASSTVASGSATASAGDDAKTPKAAENALPLKLGVDSPLHCLVGVTQIASLQETKSRFPLPNLAHFFALLLNVPHNTEAGLALLAKLVPGLTPSQVSAMGSTAHGKARWLRRHLFWRRQLEHMAVRHQLQFVSVLAASNSPSLLRTLSRVVSALCAVSTVVAQGVLEPVVDLLRAHVLALLKTHGAQNTSAASVDTAMTPAASPTSTSGPAKPTASESTASVPAASPTTKSPSLSSTAVPSADSTDCSVVTIGNPKLVLRLLSLLRAVSHADCVRWTLDSVGLWDCLHLLLCASAGANEELCAVQLGAISLLEQCCQGSAVEEKTQTHLQVAVERTVPLPSLEPLLNDLVGLLGGSSGHSAIGWALPLSALRALHTALANPVTSAAVRDVLYPNAPTASQEDDTGDVDMVETGAVEWPLYQCLQRCTQQLEASTGVSTSSWVQVAALAVHMMGLLLHHPNTSTAQRQDIARAVNSSDLSRTTHPLQALGVRLNQEDSAGVSHSVGRLVHMLITPPTTEAQPAPQLPAARDVKERFSALLLEATGSSSSADNNNWTSSSVAFPPTLNSELASLPCVAPLYRVWDPAAAGTADSANAKRSSVLTLDMFDDHQAALPSKGDLAAARSRHAARVTSKRKRGVSSAHSFDRPVPVPRYGGSSRSFSRRKATSGRAPSLHVDDFVKVAKKLRTSGVERKLAVGRSVATGKVATPTKSLPNTPKGGAMPKGRGPRIGPRSASGPRDRMDKHGSAPNSPRQRRPRGGSLDGGGGPGGPPGFRNGPDYRGSPGRFGRGGPNGAGGGGYGAREQRRPMRKGMGGPRGRRDSGPPPQRFPHDMPPPRDRRGPNDRRDRPPYF